jgi:RNA polymerase sigma factor (sigma-70 family)
VANSQMNIVIDHLRRAGLAGSEAALTDGQLLECFVSRRDEAAITTLVRRQAPMVWGVCRRVLRDQDDAEDAFQATFLVLVRKAASILPREMVANWLYGVAHKTALKARATKAKRQSREKQVPEMLEPEVVIKPDLWHDLQPLLDQELSLLPGKYRVALVLCDLENKTRKEVARQLKIPEGTLSSRLTTARTLLANRLARHRLSVPSLMLGVVLAEEAASAAVPISVLSSTIKAVSLVAAGNAVGGIVSIKVATLIEGVLKTMFVTKMKIATMVLVLVAAVSGAAGLLYGTQAGDPATPKQPPLASQATSDEGGSGSKVLAREPVRPKNEKLHALLKEKLEILQQMADHAKQLHNQNVASQDEVRAANLRVYYAKLDLCETLKDRIGVLEKIVEAMKEAEESASNLVKQGVASQEEIRGAKLGRLEAEIALEREKAKK